VTEVVETTIAPRGKPRKHDDEELLLLALLLLGDAADAVRAWDRYSNKRYRVMLLATAIESPDARPRGWWFDVEEQRYGFGPRFLSPEQMRQAVESVRESSKAAASALAVAMMTGTLEIDLWQDGFMSLLKPLALAWAALGKGGIARVDGDDLQAASASLAFSFRRLDRFARQAAVGSPQASTLPQVENRAAAYAATASMLFEDRRLVAHIAAGFDEEQNILGQAEHCTHEPLLPDVPDCLGETSKGWVGIGQLSRPGQRLCKWNCKCRLGFRRSEEARSAAA
jgi:hypothetical protein